jgi:hypothetical protein
MNSRAERKKVIGSTSPPQFRLKGLLIFTAAVAVLLAMVKGLGLAPEALLELLLVFGCVAAGLILLLEIAGRA